jgi:hypothetical protein
MGFGKFIKRLPLTKVVQAVAQGRPQDALDLTDTFSFKSSAPKEMQVNQGQEQQQAQITQLAQEKAIASESVRLQEEQARKRTLFAGTALGETSERKKLLGL